MTDDMIEAVARAICESTETDIFDVLSKRSIIRAAYMQQARAAIRAAAPLILDMAAGECEKRREDFLSPEYATGQPLSSFSERFACNECASAVRQLEVHFQ